MRHGFHAGGARAVLFLRDRGSGVVGRMQTIVLVIHFLIVVALVGVVLMQRSEGGGLGIGGGGGGGLMSSRGSANLLTRTTAILAAAFMTTSMVLAILSGNTGQRSLIDTMPEGAPPAQEAPATQDTGPQVPLGD